MEQAVTIRAILLALLTAVGGVSKAQVVFIPDTHLRDVIEGIVPGSMDANGYFDSSLPGVGLVETLTIPVTWGGTADLTGIEYFHAATAVEIVFYAPVSVALSVPAFPAVTENVAILDNDQVPDDVSVSNWPLGLRWLHMDNMSGAIAIPTVFPASLEDVAFHFCSFQSLPAMPTQMMDLVLSGLHDLQSLPQLPALVDHLELSDLPLITSVPALPAGTSTLRLSGLPMVTVLPAIPADATGSVELLGMELDALPALPNGVGSFSLDCACPGISTFTPWPSGLRHVILAGLANLTSLPEWPDSLETLGVSGLSSVISLPGLPDGSMQIIVSNMPQLAELPALNDGLLFLYLSDCPQIECLPHLPEGLLELGLYGQSEVLCLPNHPPGAVVFPDLLPLCTILNSTCPDPNPVVMGSVFNDVNSNGVHDPNEHGWPMATVHLEPGGIAFGTDSTGHFAVGVPVGTYQLTANSNTAYQMGTLPAVHTADLPIGTAIDSLNDFGLLLVPDMRDLVVDLTAFMPPNPGTTHLLTLTCTNVGTIPDTAEVSLGLTGPVEYMASVPTPINVEPDLIQWSIPDLLPGSSRSITIWVTTDTLATLGTPVEYAAVVGPLAGDASPGDNALVLIDTVVVAIDPNDKQVQPTAMTPEDVLAEEEVTYTIRFQNTGTYQANRVIITDTLSDQLQWSSMRFISSSHPCTWLLSGNGVLRFTCDPIFLPDSASDEPNSHGFVKFAMKPLSSLMLGESVGNTANIYFDFNEPVITNEAVFTVEASTAVPVLEGDGISIHPNPVNDQLWVDMGGLPSNATFVITDVTGREVMRVRERGSNAVLDVSGLGAGTYRLAVLAGNDRVVRSFVKR